MCDRKLVAVLLQCQFGGNVLIFFTYGDLEYYF